MAREKLYHSNAEKQAAYRSRKQLSGGRVVRWLEELVSQGVKFGTVYVDPPWPYDYKHMRGSAERHYQAMPIAEISALPVSKLLLPNAHVHLWSTASFLPAALQLLATWGLTYTSMLVWCKPGRLGQGHYWRISHEILLLGVKGKATFRQRNLKSWFECGRGAHSRKPDVVRHWIQQASPHPYLELFGRIQISGWTVFGDQVEYNLFE